MITLFSQESAVEAYGADREIKGAIKGAIEMCREFGATFEETIKRIAAKFSISTDDSKAYVKKYWKVSA